MQINRSNKKKRIITGFIGLLVIVVVGGLFYYSAVSAEAKEEAAIRYNNLQTNGSFYNKILNSTSKDGYLVEEITEEQVEQFAVQLEEEKNTLKKYNRKYPNNKLDLSPIDSLYKMIIELDDKLSIEKKLNNLITYSNYLSDDNPQMEKVVITDKLTDKSLDDFTEMVQSKKTTKDKWVEKVQSLINEMSKQLNQIEVATNKTIALFEGNEVKKDSSSKDYEAALIEVEKIVREKDREKLLEKLKQVKDYLEKQQALKNSSEVAEVVEEQYLLNSFDEARSYLAERMPQSGGPQQFVNGLVTSEGYYSFDYQLVGGPNGVVWNRIILDRNKNIISDEYLKTVNNDDMQDTFDYYEENTGSTVTESEAIKKAAEYHQSLGRPGASLITVLWSPGGVLIEYIAETKYIYSYYVNDDGSIIDQGMAEIITEEEYEENYE
ncbi:MAG: hypothetical protein ACOYEB_00925 [Enterococcus lemanii]|jgi:hypothetical protein